MKARCLLVLAVCVAGAPALAQRPPLMPRDPHIGYVYPAGGQRGSTIEVVVGGEFLEGAKALHVSGSGVKATVGKYTKPLTQQQFNQFREKLEEARKKMREEGRAPMAGGPKGELAMFMEIAKEIDLTEDEMKAIADFRAKLRDPKRQLNPQIAETVVVKIDISADAASGDREVRMMTPVGLSNPLRIHIGEWKECRESEPNQETPDPAIGQARPVVINGQILPGDVDRFAFEARKGERLVIVARARGLIPYLADAVPGWFQAALGLYDAGGVEVKFNDDFGSSVDPVLYCEIPSDGRYVLEVRDALYRGREDFVYRIALGELPFATGIFPMGGRSDGKAPIGIRGWNLEAATFQPDLSGRPNGICAVEPTGVGGWNSLPYAIDDIANIREQEPNGDIGQAQAIRLPVVIDGQIGAAGDWDMFRLDARAGSEIVAEVQARRLNSPMDSVLKILAPNGKEMASNDDSEDRSLALDTHHADSRLKVRIPANGTYYLRLGDTQRHGGEGYGYRLRVSSPQPDFALRVVPASVNGRAGASVPITVYALRKDGFDGDIALSLKGAPEGFELSGGTIPRGVDQLRLTITLPGVATDHPVALGMVGSGTIGGREVSRGAVPAEDMMQAFAYRHLVPASGWYATVTEAGGRFRPPQPKISVDKLVRLRAGAATHVGLRGLYGPMIDRLQLELSDPPAGVAIEKIVRGEEGLQLAIKTDPKSAKPGLRGNLIVDAYIERTFQGPGGRSNTQRIPVGTLPAIAFEVVAM